MARSLPKVCPFLVTVDLKLKWPRNTPPYLTLRLAECITLWGEPERACIYMQHHFTHSNVANSPQAVELQQLYGQYTMILYSYMRHEQTVKALSLSSFAMQ